jgi:hypothetical protein
VQIPARGGDVAVAQGRLHLWQGRTAIDRVRRMRVAKASGVKSARTAAATLGQLGRTEEGHILVGEMERIMPINTERHWQLTCPYGDPAHEVHLLDGLRRVGFVKP